jgi:hypothetical protein
LGEFVGFGGVDFEDEFVVDLHNHFDVGVVFSNPCVDVDHGFFDNVG